jgi:hypothetical protein
VSDAHHCSRPSDSHFFERLYPSARDGWLVLSAPDPTTLTRHGKPALRSMWFDLARAPLVRAAQAAAQLATRQHVYYGVALQHPATEPGAFRRSKNVTTYRVPGLWFDLDLSYGQHAASALPNTDWEALGNAYGWTLDALGDLARVLRPPGTINHMYGKPVVLLHESSTRYALEDFDWLFEIPRLRPRGHTGVWLDGQPAVVHVAAHYGAGLGEKSRTELAGAHPQHGSSTGDNFNLNPDRGLWHCWRHGTGGDALLLIAVCEGLLPCEQAGPGVLTGDRFRRVVALAQQRFGVRPRRQQPSLRDHARPAWTGVCWHTDAIRASEVAQWH